MLLPRYSIATLARPPDDRGLSLFGCHSTKEDLRVFYAWSKCYEPITYPWVDPWRRIFLRRETSYGNPAALVKASKLTGSDEIVVVLLNYRVSHGCHCWSL